MEFKYNDGDETVLLLLVLGSILVATGYVVGTCQGCSKTLETQGYSHPSCRIQLPCRHHWNAFTIPALREYQTVSSDLIIDDQASETPNYKEFTFHFTTMGKRMSGLLTVPGDSAEVLVEKPAIVMVRGYVPPENYAPGIGTQPAARYFASRGYPTLPPDFFWLLVPAILNRLTNGSPIYQADCCH